MPEPFNNPAWIAALAGLVSAVLGGVATIIVALRSKR
jgi:hypothetical protein